MGRRLSWGLMLGLVGILLALGWVRSPRPQGVTLTVSAAASLEQVLPQVATLWTESTGNSVVFNWGSTTQLAQQIERGAAVDLWVAADRASVTALVAAGLVAADSAQVYGVGRLTLWQRAEGSLPLNRLEDLARPEVTRIAIANPDLAPYGRAAQEALEAVGLWQQIQDKVILGENVRQAQQYAETGNADGAIIALSLSVDHPGQWVLIPDDLHTPIEKMLGIPTAAPHPEAARAFVAVLTGPEGQAWLDRYGVQPPASAGISPEG